MLQTVLHILIASNFAWSLNSNSYGYVECSFYEQSGIWNLAYSAYLNGTIDVNPGSQYALSSLNWQNDRGSPFEQSAHCAHISNVFNDGSIEVSSYIHNADYFQDIDTELCKWSGSNIVLQEKHLKKMSRGEFQIYEFTRANSSKSKIRIINYLPTQAQISRMNPQLAEQICMHTKHAP